MSKVPKVRSICRHAGHSNVGRFIPSVRLRSHHQGPNLPRISAGLCAFLLSFFITQRDADRQLGAA